MKKPPRHSSSRTNSRTISLRIIGGRFRGRTIFYTGDRRTRPMKDDVREALFNLIGGWIPGRYAFDLFAGTGAIGIEALSRGAIGATFIERHVPSAKMIQTNLDQLESGLPATIVTADSFYWARQFLKETRPEFPWAVFCSPPYSLFHERQSDMIELIRSLLKVAPDDSVFAVESDVRFDPKLLPFTHEWRVRDYPPARISVWR